MSISKDEFIKKHGDVVLTFNSYYKYTFTYSATLEDGRSLIANIGGNSDDIYRLDVSNNEQIKLANLDPHSAYLYKDNKEAYGFYDY